MVKYVNALRHIGTIKVKIYKLPIFKPHLQFPVLLLSIFRQAIDLEWFQTRKLAIKGSEKKYENALRHIGNI